MNMELEPVQKPEFYPFIESIPNVIECNCVTGNYSMLMKVAFPSTIELGWIHRTAPAFRKDTDTDCILYTGCRVLFSQLFDRSGGYHRFAV